MIAIIGCGAIGGSLALDLAKNGDKVVLFDEDHETVDFLRSEGFDARYWNGVLPNVGLVVVAAHTRANCALLPLLRHVPTITDCGSTKREIMDSAQRDGLARVFVGSHPYAGTHESGVSAARIGMFNNKRVYLCTSQETSDASLRAVERMWQSVGAKTELIDAIEHDRLMAWRSHLPQMSATALGLVFSAAGIERSELGPGGKDMTRLSGSGPEMWRDILETNGDEILTPIGCMIEALFEIRAAIQRGDTDAVERMLVDSREWFNHTGQS